MRKYLLAAGIAAVALAIAAPETDAQGPVRRGLRRTGEIAVDGTQRVVQGAAQGTRAVVGGVAQGAGNLAGGAVDATGAVIGGAADATRSVVGGAANAGRAVVGGTAQGVAAGVGALTPNIPLQARAGATLSAADSGRDARWRFAQHNGEWWYYTPENTWMYQRDGQWNQFAQDSFQPNPQFSGQVATGYRGVESGAQFDQYGASGQSGQYGTVHHDSYGRAYICENGRAVYIDEGQQGLNGQGQQGQYDANGQGQYQNQPSLAPQTPNDAGAAAQPPAPTDPSASATTTNSGATTTSGASTAGTAGNAQTGASGELSAESPREVLQSSGEGTMGTVEPGQSAR